MAYRVKEIFYTLQGEGAQAGRPAVFCRFSGCELKLVWPQQGCSPEDFEDLDFRHFLLQPCDDPRNKANTRECIAYCLLHPRWSLGLQTHKWVGVR